MATTSKSFHDAICDLQAIVSKIELKEGDSGIELDHWINAIDAALREGAKMQDELKSIRASVRRTVGLED